MPASSTTRKPEGSSRVPLTGDSFEADSTNTDAPLGVPEDRLSIPKAVITAAVAIGAFHLGYSSSGTAWMMALFPFGLLPLVRLRTSRQSFYTGLSIGFGLYAPQLGFFWTIFGPPAVLLWGVLALWPALFLMVGHAVSRRIPGWRQVLLLPLVWTGAEYFRSELYFLRFSWLTPGLALAGGTPMTVLGWLGVYGTGTVLFLAAAMFWSLTSRIRWLGPTLAAGLLLLNLAPREHRRPGSLRELAVAGAQIESLDETSVRPMLDRLRSTYPAAELLVLPEYTFLGRPPSEILAWCREERRYLIAGGTVRLPSGGFRNTAWVIGPEGDVVFRQAKSVPIQFFNDGLPADSQAVWESPWGRIGIAVCYDLSYSRVMDRLVRRGAEALVIPTMDALSWGPHQHNLHARIAPARAAEYGIPIVRCASSGISQIVDARGAVLASAPTDDEVRFFGGTLQLAGAGSLPIDRWLGPGATAATAALLVLLGIGWKTPRTSSFPASTTAPTAESS